MALNVKKNLLERLRTTNDILVHYAPLHTLLTEWGKPLIDHLSDWILKHPDAYVEAIRKSFEAGCDLVSTSTQAASPWRANVYGLSDKVYEMNYMSAKLAKDIMPDDKYLCGFVSSTNPDFLEPLGNLTYDEVYEGYKLQISALLEGGADTIMIVGNHPDEAVIAVKVAKDLADIPVIAHNVYYYGKAGFRTMMGQNPAEGCEILRLAGADVVGASCGLMKEKGLNAAVPGQTHYYEGATALVREMREGFDGFISIQPNAGLAQLLGDETNYPALPHEMADEVLGWVEAGARIVGGCCGTSLEHYRLASKVIREYNRQRQQCG